MYHHGKHHMAHPSHIANVQHGDVIVVAVGDDGPREAPPVSTNHAHFVKYDIEARSAPAAPPPPKTMTRFEGKTSYDMDYVKHPLETRQPVRPQTSWARKPEGPLGKSTYSVHYPWHDVQPPAYVPQAAAPKASAPFEGVTSYHTDFIKHPLRPRTPMGPRVRAVTPGPFEGTTTYNVDYQKHPAHRTPRAIAYGPTLKPDTGPFQGTTEYTREYLKHEIEGPLLVHIEPELRR